MDIKVFISSTAIDLSEHRQAVAETIEKMDGFTTIRMESFGARPSPPLEACLNQVRDADVLVVLVGHRYGTIHEPEHKSFTELEYETASELGIPILAFLRTTQDPGPLIRESDEFWNKQREFREKVSKEQTADEFGSPYDLSAGVATALANHRASPKIRLTIKDGWYCAVIAGPKKIESRRLRVSHNVPVLSPNQGEQHILWITLIAENTLESISFDFRSGTMPKGATISRPGSAYYRAPKTGAWLRSTTDDPRFEMIEDQEAFGLLLEPQRCNFMLNSEHPRKRTITLDGGDFVLWIEGTGHATARSGRFTCFSAEGSPASFTLSDPAAVTIEFHGEIDRAQLEDGANPTSYIPTSEDYFVIRPADTLALGNL